MKKKVLCIMLSVMMVFCMMPSAAFASVIDICSDFEGTVYISYSHDGEFSLGDTDSGRMAYVPIDIAEVVADSSIYPGEHPYDADGNGEDDVTLLMVFRYALKNLGQGTDDLIVQEEGTGSAYLKKGAWHFDDGTPWDENLNYYHNGMYPLGSVQANGEGWGATCDQIVIRDGDYVDVAHFSDRGFIEDPDRGFQYFAGEKFLDDYENDAVETAFVNTNPLYPVHEFNATTGEPLTACLIKTVPSDDYSTGYDLFTNTVYYSSTLFDESAETIESDAEGSYFELTFDEPGEYWLWTHGTVGEHGTAVNSPAIARVTVEGEPAPTGTDPTVLYTDGVDGSDWTANYSNIATVDKLTLSGVTVTKYSWNGSDCQVTLDGGTALDSEVTFTANMKGGSPRFMGMLFNGTGLTGSAINWKTNLSDGRATVEFKPYSGTTGNTGPLKTVHLTVEGATPAENHAPTLAAGVEAFDSDSVHAGEPYTLDLSTIFTDEDGDDLTYTVSIYFADPIPAAENFSYTFDDPGYYSFEFRANDGKATSTDAYFVQVEVTEPLPPQNHPPALKEGVPASVNEILPLREVYSLDLSTIFTDEDGDDLTYQVSINDAAPVPSNESYSYQAVDVGDYKLVFTANDGKATSTDTYTVNLTVGILPTIIAPAGSTITLGNQLDYYRYDWIEPVKTETMPDGRVKNTYDPVKGQNLFYRVQNPDGVTYWNFLDQSSKATPQLKLGDKIEVTAEDIHLNDETFTSDTVYHHFEYNNLDLGDIYLNINAQGYLAMSAGDTKELDCFRNWFAIESFTNAKVALPDFHYEVMDINGNPSDLVTIVPDVHNSGLATMTAGQGTGLAVVRVTYDSMIHTKAYAPGAYSVNYGEGGEDPTRFSHIWPETSGIFLVTVGEPDGSGIEMGMTINTDGILPHAGKVAGDRIDAEHDLLYYYDDEGATYTFKPESGTTVSIARSTVTDSGLTYNGFTTDGVTTDEAGNVTVTGLTDGRHIVKVEKNGAANYQIVTARQVQLTITDEEGVERSLDYVWQPGDKVTITLSEVDSPQEKLSGYYNNNFAIFYVDDAGNRLADPVQMNVGRYDFSFQDHTVTTTIPADWEGSKFTLSNGTIMMRGFSGDLTGGHRSCSYLVGSGMATGTSGVGVLASLPDLDLKVDQPSVTVDFTSQMSGAFLHAPQFEYEVSAGLAENYGYTDTVDGVSCLDVLVAAHEIILGDLFTPETAKDYLTVSNGNVNLMFGMEDMMPGFAVNHAQPNDGNEPEDGWYNGTLVGTTEVKDGDLIEFFYWEDPYYGDTYNWFEDKEGNYAREFTVIAGEDLNLTVKGLYAMYMAMFNDVDTIVESESPLISPQEDVQIYIVDLETGALTEIEDAVTDEDGAVTLNFDEPGTYTITGYGTEDCMFTQIMSLTKVTVEAKPENTILRLSGKSRYDTSIAAADHMKELNGGAAFDNIIIVSGLDFPDALSATYLAAAKDAPILLVGKDAASIQKITGYANENLAEGGTIYIVGGKGVVTEDVAGALTGTVERLSGKDRYKTNLAVLEEAGVAGTDLLVACGSNYADALSASAAGRPILLVGNSLTAEQAAYLDKHKDSLSGKAFIIGGKGAVSEDIEAQMAGYAEEVKRLSGKSRYLTSEAVAREFFQGNLDTIVIASGKDFPDGLAGGPVAAAYGAPLLLVADGNFDHATELFAERGAYRLVVMGGKGVISKEIAETIAAPATETE